MMDEILKGVYIYGSKLKDLPMELLMMRVTKPQDIKPFTPYLDQDILDFVNRNLSNHFSKSNCAFQLTSDMVKCEFLGRRIAFVNNVYDNLMKYGLNMDRLEEIYIQSGWKVKKDNKLGCLYFNLPSKH